MNSASWCRGGAIVVLSAEPRFEAVYYKRSDRPRLFVFFLWVTVILMSQGYARIVGA
jgi:hypothetical protein